MPNYFLPSDLKLIDHKKIKFDYGSIRRAFQAIVSGNLDSFEVKILKEAPRQPVGTFKGFRYVGNHIDGILKWEQLDQWSNKWIKCPINDVPIEYKDRVEKYIQDRRDFENSIDKYIIIKTTVQDYLNVMYHYSNRKRLDRISTVQSAFDNNRQDWLRLQKHLGGVSFADAVMARDRTNAHFVVRHGEQRDLNHTLARAVPVQYRFKFTLTSTIFAEWIAHIAQKMAVRPRILIFWGEDSKHLEIIKLKDDEPINVNRRGNIIAPRLIEQRLYRKCICCQYFERVERVYSIHKSKKELIKYVTDRVANPPREESTNPNVEGFKLAGIKTSNPVTTEIKNIIVNNLSPRHLSTPKPSNIPPFEFYNIGFMEERHEGTYEFFCEHCNQTLNPAINRLNRASISRMPPGTIHNYTDNPMRFYQGFRTAKGEKPIIMATTTDLLDRNGRVTAKKVATTVDRTLYLGVELEVTPNRYIRDLVGDHIGSKRYQDTVGYAKEYGAWLINTFLSQERVGILKSDGTVPSGFEVVSVCGTHKWHTEEAWELFFKENYENKDEADAFAPSSLLLGWGNNGVKEGNDDEDRKPICGIHIHVSRNALSEMQLGKLIHFFGDDKNKKFIEKIAGRDENKYTKYYKKKITDGRVLSKVTTDTQGRRPLVGSEADVYVPGFEGERGALNLNTRNKPTVEFRIFRSNVAKNGFMKNIDFVHAICLWCKDVSIQDLNVDSFIKFCNNNRGQYKYLTRWLVHHKFLNIIHQFNPKFTKEYSECA